MSKTIILLSMIFFLSGCRSFERKLICNQIESHQIKPHEICEVSFKFMRCRCKQFDFNSWEQLGTPVDFDVTHCDGVAGFRLTDIASDIRPNVKALAKIKGDLCSQ